MLLIECFDIVSTDMHNERPYLGRALAASIVLHAALISVGVQEVRLQAPGPLQPELTVRLPSQEAQPLPRLTLPEPQRAVTPPAPAPARPRPPAKPERPPLQLAAAPRPLSGEAAAKAAEQLARDLPYPAEAIERGLQGEALVLLFLDGEGNAIAARLERSSGHAILDEAALRAARRLRALPASAPREALMPVRFRLR
jgi:protein TonB